MWEVEGVSFDVLFLSSLNVFKRFRMKVIGFHSLISLKFSVPSEKTVRKKRNVRTIVDQNLPNDRIFCESATSIQHIPLTNGGS